jgi:hypothetical protein
MCGRPEKFESRFLRNSSAIAGDDTTMQSLCPSRKYKIGPYTSAIVVRVICGWVPKLVRLPRIGHPRGPGGRLNFLRGNTSLERTQIVAKVAATETSNSSYLLPKNSMILRNNAWVSKKGTSRVCTSDHHLLLLPAPLLFRVHKPALDTIPNFFGLQGVDRKDLAPTMTKWEVTTRQPYHSLGVIFSTRPVLDSRQAIR